MAIAGNIALDHEVYIRVTEWEDGTKNLLQNERTRKVHFFFICSNGTTDVQNILETSDPCLEQPTSRTSKTY